MKELNWEKYKALNLTETYKTKTDEESTKSKIGQNATTIDTTRWTPSLLLLQNLLSFSS